MRLSPMYLTFLLELCLLGLASFLGALLLWTFWRFYSKGGECETKASWWFKLSSSLILVIHDNIIIGTNRIVLACLCRHF
jgi:uncharacterized Tic20 family protein